ncbi:MAG: helix-turn-helix transcriptional regulator [Urechidicola sp.]|nr:helix-turn-helix transcriptional regulator [Urechidicola sp.]
MVNDFFKNLIDETPRDVQIFVDKYEEISMRIYQLLKSKGMSQKDLAQSLGKRPSEISKWLNEGHNLTLKTIAKIEAVLGEDIINVPLRQSFNIFEGKDAIRGKMNFTVYKNNKPSIDNLEMTELTPEISQKIA